MPGVNFNISHRNKKKNDVDPFFWAEEERKKFGRKRKERKSDQWELDVRTLMSSESWLKIHGLKKKHLKLPQILSHIGFKHSDGYIESLKKPVGSYYGEGLFKQMKSNSGQIFNVTVGKETLLEVQKNLKNELYTLRRRHEWLTNGSRKMLGVIQEHIVCIVLDVSTMVQSQFDMYREALIETLEDQVSQLVKFNMIRAQNDICMWQQSACAVTDATLKDARKWIWDLDRMAEMSTTSCTEAVVKALEDESLEAVYLFTEGDVSESSKELLRQKLKETPIPVNTISFNATKPGTLQFLKEVAMECGGRFHAFVVKSQYEDEEDINVGRNSFQLNGSVPNVRLSHQTRGGMPAGAGVREDVFLIWQEMEECRNVLADIENLIQSIEAESEQSPNKLALVKDLSKLEENCLSSKEWLRLHGLNAQKMTVYHALASCAFKHIDDVIELKQKSGKVTDQDSILKLIEAKYCKNFPHMEWKDGTIVHVYISAELFRNYERKMNILLDSIQQRIDWLQQGSREVFGSILEERVYFLLDTSYSMTENLENLKERVLQLFQEQLRHKTQFNIIKYESQAVCWRPRLEDVSEDNLLDAWQWVKGMTPGGSTNTLAALRLALADPNTEGIYLLTDGRPDQPLHCILSQVQLRKPVPIHTISFNCHDKEANTFLHQLALDTGGRYHCYTTHGGLPFGPAPFESEDIALLKAELKRGQHDLKKVSSLRDQCVMLDWFYNRKGNKDPECLKLMNSPRASAPCCLSREPKTSYPAITNGTDVPSNPSVTLGMKTQPTLLAISHKEHRGKYGVNDHSAPSTQRSEAAFSVQNESFSTLKSNKKKKTPKKRCKPMRNSEWLKTHGLVARRLTLMDALGPTVIKQKTKFVPILNKNVVSKVFDEVLPLAHVSPRNMKQISLVNPNAVDLKSYQEKLNAQLVIYKRRLYNQVMPHLDEENQTKFQDMEIFWEDIDAVTQLLIDLNWPVEEDEYRILMEEIQLGEKYLTQSVALKEAASENTLDKLTASKNSKEDDNNGKKKKKPKKKKKVVKIKEIQSSSSTESKSTSSASTLTESSDEELSIEKMNKRISVDDMLYHLTGIDVIARQNLDGFYSEGVVLQCIDVRYAYVKFIDGEQQITSTRHIIPINKDLMLPPLKLGDYVLAKVKSSEADKYIYYPGMIINIPSKKKESKSKKYRIVLYGELHKNLPRRNLVKISESRYHLTRQYIRLQLERLDQEAIYETSSNSSDSDSSSQIYSVTSVSTPQDNASAKQLVSASSEESPDLKSIREKLEHLHEMLLMQTEEIEQKKRLQNEKMSRATSPIAFEKEKHDKNTGTSEDEPIVVAVDSEKNSMAITRGDSGIVISRQPPEADALIGTEVLSRWSDDGWYYRGTICKFHSSEKFDIVDSGGSVDSFYKDDVIFDEDDRDTSINVGACVVALYPMYRNSFAPAVVTGVSDYDYNVKYYTGDTERRTREEIYFISDEKYSSSVAYIRACEKQWVGQAVIARFDYDGSYQLASCLRQLENSRSYELQWSDGSKSVQHITCMFGAHTRKRNLDVGNFVIALANQSSLLYLPGYIHSKSKKYCVVQFCDKSMNTMSNQHCYYISKEYYELAVKYYIDKMEDFY